MASPNTHILAINQGSSSIKFAKFGVGEAIKRVFEGEIKRIGLPDATLCVKVSEGDQFVEAVKAPDHRGAAHMLMDWMDRHGGFAGVVAVGHRVVHGGPKYSHPEVINEMVLKDLDKLSPFDPEHMPNEISLIESFRLRFPDLPQVACFDTAFHQDMPRVAKLLPIPRRYESKGIRRYGFHGLSYEFLMEQLTHRVGVKGTKGRIILAHLGNGASLTAVHKGKSIDTTMSFTPTSGVPMSTRSGDLDPGLVSYFSKTEGMDARGFHEMVNFQSGLLGVSEISSDMQYLLKVESKDVRAQDAVQLFCYRVKKEIGALSAALGGLDTLVFSGGIGENSPIIRSRICQGLQFLGFELDEKANRENGELISAKKGQVEVHVIPTDEEWMIAKTLCTLLKLG